ncbi:MAG: hypothetical protein V3T05_08980, partial [Myxococcota bacterium]
MGALRTLGQESRSLWVACATAVTISGCVYTEGDPGPAPQPQRAPGDIADQPVVIIPADWRELPVFVERFATDESAGTIELAATRFLPATLNGPGGRDFGGPDAGTFSPDLLREPFVDVADDIFIVQARSLTEVAQLRQTLEALGTLQGYIPHNAYLVRITEEQYDVLAQAPEVGWLGFFQPAWRVAPKLDYLIEYAEPRELRVTTLFDAGVYTTAEQVAGALAGSGFAVISITRRSRDWKVRLAGSTADIGNLVAMRGCTWVERFAEYVLHNNVARTSGSTTTGRGSELGPIMDVED